MFNIRFGRGIIGMLFLILVPVTSIAETDYRENTITTQELLNNLLISAGKLHNLFVAISNTTDQSNVKLTAEIHEASKNGYMEKASKVANRYLNQISQNRSLNMTNLYDFMRACFTWSNGIAKITAYAMAGTNFEKIWEGTLDPFKISISFSYIGISKDLDVNDIANRYRDFCVKAVSAIHQISQKYSTDFPVYIISETSALKHLKRQLDWCPARALFTNMDHGGHHIERKINCINYSVSTLSTFGGETSFPRIWVDALEAYGNTRREYFKSMQIVQNYRSIVSPKMSQDQLSFIRETMEDFARDSKNYFTAFDKFARIYLVDVPVLLYTTKYLENIRSNHRVWFDQKDEMMPWALKLTQLTQFIPYTVLPTTAVYYQSASSYTKKSLGSKLYSEVLSQSQMVPLWINVKKMFRDN